MSGPGPKKINLEGNTPKERFQSARAMQAEVNAKIDAAKSVGSKFGNKARAAEKASVDSVAFDAGQEFRKSRKKS